MDAIAFLKHEHRTVEQLFSRYEDAREGATRLKRKLVDQMISALSQHASIEEEFFYPAARAALVDDPSIVLESLEEHHVVKWTLNELMDLPPTHERFDAKVSVLMESVRHHVHEEEHELFPKLRKAMSKTALNVLGQQLAAAKKSAPHRPEPHKSDTPSRSIIARRLAALNGGRVKGSRSRPAGTHLH